ncbi:hypothetical protein [Thalassoglobus sp.]|uniref:hypothetical protein n=1 Tax=Thalassoglobus sp. TaxID=2795869 RepID=UPI003AA7B132
MKTVLAFCLLTLVCASADAQSNRDQRKDFVEGLLKSLIDSQLDRGRPSPDRTPPNLPPNADLQQAQVFLDALTNQSAQLVNLLRVEERSMPQLRPLLADALTIHADARMLRDDSRSVRDQRALTNSVREFDRKWRTLAHRLKQIPELGRASLRTIDSITDLNTSLSQLLGIDPQFDRNSLLRLSSSVSTSMGHLNQELRYQLHRNPIRDQILTQGYQLSLQASQLVSLVDRSDYKSIVASTQSFQQAWKVFAVRLRELNSERIQRDMLEIEQSLRDISEILWLTAPIDKAQIVQLTQTIEREFDLFLDNVSLAQLIRLNQTQNLIKQSTQFHASAHLFAETAERSQNLNDLSWDFQVLEVEWKEFLVEARRVNLPAAQQQIQMIQRSMNILQNMLNLRPQLDRRELLPVVASADDLSDRLLGTGKRIIGNSGAYPGTFRIKFLNELNELHDSAHQLHDGLIQTKSESELQRDAEHLIEHWNGVKQLVPQLRQQDQQQIMQIMAQLEPNMVKLQVIFY